MENPFQFGRELGADELVNRTDELKEIEETIRSSGKLFVIGPRRFGKTSILKAAAEKSSENNNLILRYNAESFGEIESLIQKIIEDSAKALKGKAEQTGDKIKEYFKSLRPELSFSVTQTEWKTSLGVSVARVANSVGLLVDAFNGLENLASDQAAGKKVALIIDEFQEIITREGLSAEKQIRAAIQTHKNTAYIFAGSKTSILTEMTTDASRPFYRLGKLLFVGELPRTEFSRFLIDKFTYASFFSPHSRSSEKTDLALRILDLSEDVPYNVQFLAHSLWNRLSQIEITSAEKAILTEKLIDETLDKIIRQMDPFYTQLWNGFTSIQKKSLIASASEDGKNLQSHRVTTDFHISASSMRKSLSSLVSQDILRHAEDKGNVKFRFEDPFFKHWIKTFTF